jgi:hypothetical protein
MVKQIFVVGIHYQAGGTIRRFVWSASKVPLVSWPDSLLVRPKRLVIPNSGTGKFGSFGVIGQVDADIAPLLMGQHLLCGQQ